MKKAPLAFMILAVAIVAFFSGTWVAYHSSSKNGSSGRKILYYVDPMHPAYKSDKPGIAPDCGMQLEPVYEDGSMGGAGHSAVPGTVNLPPEKQQAIGVAVRRVERTP